MKKMGRPTDDPKTMRLNIWISENDKAKLDYCKEKTGKTAPEIAREGIDSIYRSLKKKERG